MRLVLNRIKKYIWNHPRNLEEYKKSESKALRLVGGAFLITSLFIMITLFSKGYYYLAKNNKTLFQVIILNFFGFFSCSLSSYFLSRKINKIETFTEIGKIKRSYYFSYLFLVGIPYFCMTSWLYLEKDLKSSLVMVIIFLGSLLTLILDWNMFLQPISKK